MGEKREGDGPDILNWHSCRSNRVFEAGEGWFFQTREGTVEGPFANQAGANHRINVYIQIMNPNLLPGDADYTVKLLVPGPNE